jgi:ABC-type transporter Mla subunit MlaD
VKRILAILLAGAAVFALAFLATGAGDDEDLKGKYFVELDNAFGLIEGADVKIAGVRAGKIASMDISRKEMRALIGLEVTEEGFGDLRQDVFCETRPQSLIGEYYVDCQPGKSPRKLKPGSTIPVEQTGSTVPVDLVNNIMRRPYRERFSILLSELGAALAARGDDLDETIRRANPALREVDKLLAILADQKRTIANLYRDADVVIGELADNKGDVTRFVREARDTSTASATRANDIRRQFQLFPTFLRELQPTMRLLGEAADRQTPALRTLAANAPLLEDFFDALGPFSEASRPAFRSLAAASKTGRRAVVAARPPIAELRKGVDVLPEVADNLAMTFKHLDDPKFATEKDPRSGRKDGGFTGLEALLRYIYAQSQAINLYDENSYMLKVNAFLDRDCANYADIEDARNEAKKRCRTGLGPTQPGINTPDPTMSPKAQARSARAGADPRAAGARSGDGQRGGSGENAPTGPGADGNPMIPDVESALDKALPTVPELPATPRLPDTPKVPDTASPKAAEDVLDFLLGS